MAALATNLGVLFGSRLATNLIAGILVPYFMYRRTYHSTVKKESKLVRPEKEYFMQRYDTTTIALDSFTNLVIQYGYTALFITALPLASTFALVTNIAEAKADAWKLLNLYQRAKPTGCQDIGRW